ncbi:MAG: YIP1 family protein [Anaerolineae bacterium]|nr:YIP1 family protein [Anaerolineae bacterium]
MRGLLAIAWGAARREPGAFVRWRSSAGLAGGLAVLLAVSLFVASADAVIWTRSHLELRTLCSSRDQLVERLCDELSYSPFPTDLQQSLTTNLAALLELQSRLEALPRPLGHQGSWMLQGASRALSAPYRRLAVWLPYSLIVFALARALGSRAGLPQVLGASALYVLPHILDPLRLLPGPGPAIVPLTTIWGAAIYARAIQVASGLDAPRALLAVLLPTLVAVTVSVGAVSVAAVVF